MCGIVGYNGNKKATPILISGLQCLEYRGYDSAGIAVIENNKIITKKDIGRVNNLLKLDGINELNGSIGIAHTRWATHGKPSSTNAHPHADNSALFSVVHNGIIENYVELKEFLTNKGYKFISQTDTEVIPNLIHYYYTNSNLQNEDKFLQAVNMASKDLRGSYGLLVISSLFPDKIIVTRHDSPIVLGTTENEQFIASDIPAMLPYTKDFYFLDDKEFAVIYSNNIKFYDSELNEHSKESKHIAWSESAAQKNGYEDFMLKEIYEQPTAIRNTINLDQNGDYSFNKLNFTKEFLQKFNKIFIIGCGTARHAGLVGQSLFEKLCQLPVEVDVASEFRYRNPLINDKTLCIYISQSGETADTIAALKLAKEKGATTLAISNVIGSSITREADYTLYTQAGPEIAVASTKAYTCQVTLIALLALHFAEILETSNISEINRLRQELSSLPAKVEKILQNVDNIKKYADKIYNEKNMFFLGRGIDYCTALEGSLKLKEISYIHSEAYPSGELKHGPISLIEDGITVIGIITDEKLVEKSMSNLQEVITRGAKTVLVTNQEITNSNIDFKITIPTTDAIFSSILSIVPLQILSYYISKNKGLDVDKPKNLAKSVTVE